MAGEAYSLGQSNPGEGGSLRLTVVGGVGYVLVGSPLDRVWDGEGTLELTDTSDQDLTVNVQGESASTPTVLKLESVAEGMICYMYTVGEPEGETVQCED
jgi:hypothetical protein